jgi:flagellar biosynthetic protein FliR
VIEAFVVAYSLVLARSATFVTMLPVLGGDSVPRTVKVGLSVALAAFQIATHGAELSPDFVEQASRVTWLTFGLSLGREAALGAFLGCLLGLVLLPVRVAGEYLGQEMGLALGPLVGPTGGPAATVVSQLFEALATLLLLGLDGHHLFLAALHSSFLRVPLGGAPGPLPAAYLVTGITRAQEWGLLLAAPLGAAMFLTSVVLALLSRVAPQLNLFSVGFTLRVAAGLGGAFLLLPDFVRAGAAVLAHFDAFLRGVV